MSHSLVKQFKHVVLGTQGRLGMRTDTQQQPVNAAACGLHAVLTRKTTIQRNKMNAALLVKRNRCSIWVHCKASIITVLTHDVMRYTLLR